MSQSTSGTRSRTGIDGKSPDNELAGAHSSGNAVQNHRRVISTAVDIVPHNMCAVWLIKLFSFYLLLFFFIIPAAIMMFPGIISEIAFSNRFQISISNLDRPIDFGLSNAYNFRLDTADGVNVGAWHILPKSMLNLPDNAASTDYQHLFTSGNPIILYLHGNCDSRALSTRVEEYKILSSAGFHVVSFDYRGFADSTGDPTEIGLVEDSISVFKWLKHQAGDGVPIYIWGHSLGSAIGTRAANILSKEGANLSGLILEAPFNNFIEAATMHPFSWCCRWLPWFNWVLVEAVKSQDIHFASDKHIVGVTVPILVLHALDDSLVPYELGLKLYEVARQQTNGHNVQLATFDGDHRYDHDLISKSPEFISIVRSFMKLE